MEFDNGQTESSDSVEKNWPLPNPDSGALESRLAQVPRNAPTLVSPTTARRPPQ
jgi:hypothetical protein